MNHQKRITIFLLFLVASIALFPDFLNDTGRFFGHWVRAIAEPLTFFVLFVYNDAPVTEEGMALVFTFTMGAALVYAGMRIGRSGRRAKRVRRIRPKKREERVDDVTDAVRSEPSIAYTYVEADVIKHFLEIYRYQLGAGMECPGRFEQVADQTVSFGTIYELGVMVNGEWSTRRLTIGPLGVSDSHRSYTWFVIYDRYIVVKIPPKPLTDFDDYIKELAHGNSLADRLAPTEWVVPNVSVMMELLEPGRSSNLTSSEVERGHMGRISVTPQLQRFLRIGPSFAFFMDLSRYYFLNQVLDDLHISDQSIKEEILGHPHILWDINEFEGRYGKHRGVMNSQINSTFEQYEEAVGGLLVQYGIGNTLPVFSVRSWFIHYLSGAEKPIADQSLSPAFLEELATVTAQAMADKEDVIKTYREMVHGFLFDKNVVKTRSMICSIVTNLLDLLAGLNKRYIAIRDIKPDNLLIAGNPANYPTFLSVSTEFKLGVIDVETAAYLSMGESGCIEQPILGGTPRYATPSNLFSNEAISNTFGEVARILRLQDWHAIMAMIFKVVTGKDLFMESAVLIPEIVRILSVVQSESGENVYEYVSRIYFKKAVVEFEAGMAEHAKILEDFQVIILKKNQKSLKAEIDFCALNLKMKIEKMVEEQALFPGEKNQSTLKKASSLQVDRLIDTWKSKKTNSIDNRALILEALRFLRTLHGVKVQYEEVATFSRRFDEGGMKVSVDALLRAMFQTVFYSMYGRVWGELVGSEGVEFSTEVTKGTTLDKTFEVEAPTL